MKSLSFLLFICAVSTASAEDLSLGMLGWEKTQQGDHKGAIELFQRCIAEGNLTQASLARTYRNIGIALRRDGRPLEAVDSYEKSIQLKPDDVHMDYVNKGNAYSDALKYEEALAEYDKAQAILPHYNEAYYNRGLVYERQEKKEQAIEQFKLAYQHGLRSQLLYERFVAYGLLEDK